MAALPLTRPPRNDDKADHHEEAMPTHVIWGEVENDSRSSLDHDSSRECSAEISGQATPQGRVKCKLQNRRLNASDVNNGDDNHHITFRDPGSHSQAGSEEDGFFVSVSSFASRDGGSRSAQELSRMAQSQAQLRMTFEHQAAPSQSPDDEDEEEEGDDHTYEYPGQPPQQIVAQVSPAEYERVLSTVRRTPSGEPTSLGSAGHPTDCKPCLFVFTKVGCQNFIVCTFCHFKHKRGNRPRPCKGKRNRYRKLMERMENIQASPGAEGEDGTASQLVDL